MTTSRLIAYLVIAIAVVATAAVFVSFFEQFRVEGTRLGIDNIFYELDEWDIHYSVTNGLRNPPWSVLPLVPVASLFSRNAAWGLLVYFTLAVTVFSVPRARPRWRYWLAVLLVSVSFPTLRNIADANLEGLVIAGVLLVLAGYKRQHPLLLAAGILIATVKPQSVSLLMIVLAVYVVQTWQPRKWVQCAALVAAVVIPTMLWRGGDWLAAVQGTYQAGSIIDIGLAAALRRTGVVPPLMVTISLLAVLVVTLGVAWFSRREWTREKAGMLLCGGMLVAPYVAGNSIATILAIGIIPLFLARPLIGGILIAMVNVPLLWSAEFSYNYQSYWWTLILLLSWGIFNWRIYQHEIKPKLARVQPSAMEAPGNV